MKIHSDQSFPDLGQVCNARASSACATSSLPAFTSCGPRVNRGGGGGTPPHTGINGAEAVVTSRIAPGF